MKIPRLGFIIIMFCRYNELNANNVDPDQTPHFAASDLGLKFSYVPFMGH